MLNETSQTQSTTCWMILFLQSRVGETTDTENRLVVARNWSKGVTGNDCLGTRKTFCNSKTVSFMLCEFHLNFLQKTHRKLQTQLHNSLL